MNIYAQAGSKVIFTNPEDGYTYDQEHAKKYLVKGEVYTVANTEVGSWRTDVYLEEFPDTSFNSVHFSDR